MAFTYSIGGAASIGPLTSVAGTDYAVNLNPSVTFAVFGTGAYVISSTYTLKVDGTITLGGGAINTVTQQSTPWWTFDTSDYFCSRFAVILPTGFATLTAQELSTIRSLIQTWRPGNMTCVEIICVDTGRLWGWPIARWGDAGLVWGGTSTSYSP